MPSIRLLIADDRSVTRSGLAALAQQSPDLYVAGEANDAADTLRAAKELAPDVVLLNLRDLPCAQLPELVRGIDDAAVIVLRSAGAEIGLRAAIAADVAGYADLEALDGDLAQIVDIVHRGCSVCVALEKSLSLTDIPLPDAEVVEIQRWRSLTDREHTVLRCISSGASNREIADALHVSVSTVKKHCTNLMRKLRVTSRVEAALLYSRSDGDQPAGRSSFTEYTAGPVREQP